MGGWKGYGLWTLTGAAAAGLGYLILGPDPFGAEHRPAVPGKLLNRYLPAGDLAEVYQVAVDATPEEAYAAARRGELTRGPVSRALFWLRDIPNLVARLLRGSPPAPTPRLTIDQLTAPNSGFQLLAEDPGVELVIGSVGKFWQPRIDFLRVAPEEFAAAAPPGYGKLAWNILVQPLARHRATITIGLRVALPDEDTRRRFARYWRLIRPFSALIRQQGLVALKTDAEARHRLAASRTVLARLGGVALGPGS